MKIDTFSFQGHTMQVFKAGFGRGFYGLMFGDSPFWLYFQPDELSSALSKFFNSYIGDSKRPVYRMLGFFSKDGGMDGSVLSRLSGKVETSVGRL